MLYCCQKQVVEHAKSITGGFEQKCLRTILGPFRLRVGAPTRNPKERPSELPLTLARQDVPGQRPTELETVLVPTQEFPIAFIGLRLREARLLRGEDPIGNVDGELWAKYNTDEVKKYIPDGTTESRGVKIGKFNAFVFARLLAKIGHAYATAECGFGSFRPLATNLILGKTDTLSQWVGGEWDIPPATKAVTAKAFCSFTCAYFPSSERPNTMWSSASFRASTNTSRSTNKRSTVFL